MRRRLLCAVVVLGLGTVFLRGQTASLPELPQIDLTVFPSVIRGQVEKAYDAARAHPGDANASG